MELNRRQFLETAAKVTGSIFIPSFLACKEKPTENTKKERAEVLSDLEREVQELNANLESNPDVVSRIRVVQRLGECYQETSDESLKTKIISSFVSALSLRRPLDEAVHSYVAREVVKIGEPAKDTIPWLIKALDDDTSEAYHNVVRALRVMGPLAAAAVPHLRMDLEKRGFTDEIVITLRSIGTPEALAAIEEYEERLMQQWFPQLTPQLQKDIKEFASRQGIPPKRVLGRFFYRVPIENVQLVKKLEREIDRLDPLPIPPLNPKEMK